MQTEKQHENAKKHIPWWLHLALAILSYVALKYGLQELGANQTEREKLAQIGSQAAPIITIGFLFLAANALYRNVPERNLEGQEKEEENQAPRKGQGEIDR